MKKIAIYAALILLLPIGGFCSEIAGPAKIMDVSGNAGTQANDVLTLENCYELALKQSELIAIDSEKIKEAEAHFLQAFGTIMPQVSFSHIETRNNSQGFSSYNKTHEAKFVFTQALFSGFKEFAGMAAGHFEKSQREKEKLRAQQLLFVDVCDAFYLLMETQEDLAALETVKYALIERVNELKARENIGKSRLSEVVSTQAQLYNLEADIEFIRSQRLIAQELLEFLVGKLVDKIIDLKTEFNLRPESEYLSEAALRPDVQAADFAWKVDKENIAVAKSGFLPQVNLEGDYYTHRSATPADSKWGALFKVNVPIFEGTTVYGQVKEARSQAKESELLFKRLGRIALQDIHDAYIDVQTDLVRRSTLAKALKSAELNYHLQSQDYKLNVVNNLDVLAAIQNLQDVRRSFIHVSYESKRFYWHLLAAAGEINVSNQK